MKFDDVKEKFFETNNRITANEVLKQQFENFQRKQTEFDDRMAKFQNDMHDEFSRLKHDYNTEFYEVSNTMKYFTNKVTAIYPEIETLNDKVKHVCETQETNDRKLEDLNKLII